MVFVFLPLSFVKASVSLTEVMYDPAGSDDKHEWVEVVNNGSSSIDMTKYFLQTDGVGSSYHSITSVGTNTLLLPGSFAIIAQDVPTFLADQPGFGGLVFDSSWSDLSDSTGKTLVINDSTKTALDQYTYDPSIGASNDGNSLQKNSNGVWIAASPTPGFATLDNLNSSNASSTNAVLASGGLYANDGTSSTSTSVSTVVPSSSVSSANIELTVPKTATVGVPVNISYSVSNVGTIPVNSKTFRVSLGDGAVHYDYSQNAFSHTYAYPGTYVVYFEFMHNPYDANDSSNLSIRKTIDVLPSSVVISNIGIDGSVEISNPGSREIDLSNWTMRSLSNPDVYFTFPDNTIVLAGKKIILSKEITGFEYSKIHSLELSLPSGLPVVVYNSGNSVMPADVRTNPVPESVESSYSNTVVATTSVSSTATQTVSKKSTKKITNNYSATLSVSDIQPQDIASNSDVVLESNILQAVHGSSTSSNLTENDFLPVIPIVVGFAGIIIAGIYAIKTSPNLATSSKLHSDDIRIIED